MKKEQIRQQLQEQNAAAAQAKIERRNRKIKKISPKLQQKLCRSLQSYIRSSSFQPCQIESMKLNLFLAAQKSKEQLENELEQNRVEINECTKKSDLVCRVAHGRTFGKIVKKCPTCRTGQLQLEIEEGRYICQYDDSLNCYPQQNCGLAYDFSEIEHINWINSN
ncbi:hypothetical protein TTHERM_00411910 (macronuclear) [Tetrahymena thermophila SB210]|uniref:Uncharacterized protein n=1 Tax=Tetrahymena thermophila (strain SB210) TaxID=312017 RepID=I7MKY9_TETTS|nr:hypothetical protein TTHERM_00411910 [Tetrahymena thermophila SB210]EAS00640.1 hypothetical protein TTHERM_00411910 [Tetrahymena thermophila SB210]|eukprot:XP_001020885.1 hypothetical protein TTHERM_00411910 [Tetrahymena thermophila SB210]